MIDTTSFTYKCFYLQKQKDFISNTKKHTVKTNTHQSQSLLSSFTLFNKRVLICRHFDINSDLLFNMFTSSRFLIIKAFPLRHKLQLLIKVLPLTRLAIENIHIYIYNIRANLNKKLHRFQTVLR